MSSSTFHAGIWSGLDLHNFVCFVAFTVSSYVQLPCCVQKMMFIVIYHLRLFLYPLFQLSMSLGGRGGLRIYVLYRIEQSAFSYSLYLGQFCVNHNPLQLEASPMRNRQLHRFKDIIVSHWESVHYYVHLAS